MSWIQRSGRTLPQIVLILAFWLGGEGFVRLTRLPLPGSIPGLFLLLCLLSGGWLKLESVRRGAYWFLGEMLLFFIPALMAVLDHREFAGWLGIRIFAAILLGTLLVMTVTALVVEMGYRWSLHVDK